MRVLDFCLIDVIKVFFILQNHIPTDIIVDNGDEILVLGFNDSLATGNGVLKICFSGTLNEQLKGLYRWCSLFFYPLFLRSFELVVTPIDKSVIIREGKLMNLVLESC